MKKRADSLKESMKEGVKRFLELTKGKDVLVVSHFDTDGISSAAIMTQALRRMDKKFSVKILKRLDPEFISSLEKEKVVIFLDLASGMLDNIKEAGIKEVFIIDHHEIVQEIPESVTMINSMLHGENNISSSGLVYLFCKEINPANKDLAKLAVLGMIGDLMESSIDKLNNGILEYGDIKLPGRFQREHAPNSPGTT